MSERESADATVRLPSEPTGSATSLVVFDGSAVTTHVLPDKELITIGRAESCDIVIPSASLSREHARIRRGETLTLEDLGSANGTRVGAAALEPHAPVALGPGAACQLGRVLVVVRQGGASDVVVERADDAPMANVNRLVERVAQSSLSVLLLGETGVGKEVMAERIHRLSPRASKPLVRVNCAALSETLLESELFGHERGAFTGAVQAKPGLLESAEGGTVLLDEIGELSPAVQVKLLRVLEERKVQRVGALDPQPIDVRFVAATHRDLRAEIAAGRFRQDLYFRLNGISIALPALRERRAEIATLARQFVARTAKEQGRPVPDLAPAAITALERHDWPGNIRELKNVVERTVVLAAGPTIGAADLHWDEAPATRETDAKLASAVEKIEAERITQAMQACAGNQTRAAKMLGISRNTLLERLERFGLPRPRKRTRGGR